MAVASAATDAFDGAVCTAGVSGASSSGFFVSLSATTRSGSSVSVGIAFGRSVCSTAVFCSATSGEAADASASGPGGRSLGS
jgi:hypothetical protein